MVVSTTPEPPAPLDDDDADDDEGSVDGDDAPAGPALQGVALLRSVFPGRVIRVLRPPATVQAGAAAEPTADEAAAADPAPDLDPDPGSDLGGP